jgi:hypothetical protein
MDFNLQTLPEFLWLAVRVAGALFILVWAVQRPSRKELEEEQAMRVGGIAGLEKRVRLLEEKTGLEVSVK